MKKLNTNGFYVVNDNSFVKCIKEDPDHGIKTGMIFRVRTASMYFVTILHNDFWFDARKSFFRTLTWYERVLYGLFGKC